KIGRYKRRPCTRLVNFDVICRTPSRVRPKLCPTSSRVFLPVPSKPKNPTTTLTLRSLVFFRIFQRRQVHICIQQCVPLAKFMTLSVVGLFPFCCRLGAPVGNSDAKIELLKCQQSGKLTQCSFI